MRNLNSINRCYPLKALPLNRLRPAVGTFETCRPLPIMSVVRRRPEVVFRVHHDRLTRSRHRAPSPKYFTPSFKGCALFGFELAIFAIDRSATLFLT
jgi:hypothetical protein